LHAIGEPSRKIVHEVISGGGITIADIPARDKFGFGINRRPRPNVAPALALFLGRHIDFLAADERPNFVALDKLAGEIAENLVLIFGTGET
jgi:hypothetical protein